MKRNARQVHSSSVRATQHRKTGVNIVNMMLRLYQFEKKCAIAVIGFA
ncbi:hypothetical protein [Paracidovorax valerianellae]|nr:hypothetical protein [Paracidovorax valerianellae]MDA8443615.1 hypothetical protein [Paracidovorax valerianellae]